MSASLENYENNFYNNYPMFGQDINKQRCCTKVDPMDYLNVLVLK